MMRRGRIVVTYEMIKEALRLPADAAIEAIAPQSADEVGSRLVSFVVSGPTMPLHLEGTPLVIVRDWAAEARQDKQQEKAA